LQQKCELTLKFLQEKREKNHIDKLIMTEVIEPINNNHIKYKSSKVNDVLRIQENENAKLQREYNKFLDEKIKINEAKMKKEYKE